MTVRILNRNGSGGLRFKRNLTIKWTVEQNVSAESIIGTNGKLVHAITFGDPYASPLQGPIILEETCFTYYKLTKHCNLQSSLRDCKIVDGPFFKSKESEQINSEIKALSACGAWADNLPSDSFLTLNITNLIPDNVYEIRCMFVDGKNKVSPRFILDPGNYEVEYDRQNGCIVIGKFTAPTDQISIKIKSTTNQPPHINAMTMRTIDNNPRVTLSELRTIVASKR